MPDFRSASGSSAPRKKPVKKICAKFEFAQPTPPNLYQCRVDTVLLHAERVVALALHQFGGAGWPIRGRIGHLVACLTGEKNFFQNFF